MIPPIASQYTPFSGAFNPNASAMGAFATVRAKYSGSGVDKVAFSGVFSKKPPDQPGNNRPNDLPDLPDKPNQAKSSKLPWFYRPVVSIMSLLYLHPGMLQWVVPDAINPLPSVHEIMREPHTLAKTFKSLDGTKLQGYWMSSLGAKSDKTIILGHGYYGNAAVMVDLAKHFRRNGFNVFLFDFRAHGKSGGNTTSIGFHEGKDVAAAVEFVRASAGEQAQDLFYMGHSMGAAALMMTPKSLEAHPGALARLTKHLDGVILDSPYAYLKPSENAFVTQIRDFKPRTRLGRWVWGWFRLPLFNMVRRISLHMEQESQSLLNLPFPITEFNTKQTFQPLQRQIHVHQIHGQDDTSTRIEDARNIFEFLKKGTSRILRFVTLDADHTFRRQVDNRYTVLRDPDTYIGSINQFIDDVMRYKYGASFGPDHFPHRQAS
ncbi:MAG: alpha/beta fold hydrolase [Cyanobacteria bacterium HKST-UBA04]|nr:alpha/beta fold hydrolase [Cyanobacteria bacterium HKST-UBA04]